MGFFGDFMDKYSDTILQSIAYQKGRRDGREDRGRNMLYYSSHKQPFQRDAYDLGYQEGCQERYISNRRD